MHATITNTYCLQVSPVHYPDTVSGVYFCEVISYSLLGTVTLLNIILGPKQPQDSSDASMKVKTM